MIFLALTRPGDGIILPKAAVRVIKPGGILLLTSHGISKIARREGTDDCGEYWHFTGQSLAKMLKEEFSPPNVTVNAFGSATRS